jgi:hypothetical protein
MQRNATLTFLSLFRSKGALRVAHWNGLQLMWMTCNGRIPETIKTLIKVSASRTMEALPL